MVQEKGEVPERSTSPIDELGRLLEFNGLPAEYWPRYISAATRLAGAARGLLLVREDGDKPRLGKLAEWPSDARPDAASSRFLSLLPELTAQALGAPAVVRRLEGPARGPVGDHAVALRIAAQGATGQCLGAFLLLLVTEAEAEAAAQRLQLAAKMPLGYAAQLTAGQLRQQMGGVSSTLELIATVGAEKRFLAAALALCNGLADGLKAERVSLGWLEGNVIKLKAIARTESFSRSMSAVRSLEQAMEECLDQNEDVRWPASADEATVSREHAAYASGREALHLLSVPLRTEGNACAVVTAERATAFAPGEAEQVRLALDLVTGRLAELKQRDRWFGARWAAGFREQCGKLVGPRHTWTKLLAVLGAVAGFGSLLPIVPYRAEGKFILRSDEVAYLSAPFDGHIKSVQARPGDEVQAQGVLLRLNTDDLELEESAALADQHRYLREAEKARAAGSLADMRISQSLAEQAKARLDLARYRAQQAQVQAPFGGVVVEGDLRQRLGAPVKAGDALLKVARSDRLYVEVEVDERDVHEILGHVQGEIAFLAQPRHKHPVRLVVLEPAGFPKERQNVFLLRAEFAGPAQSWWRPGMTGVCKINVDKRSLLWILSHRTVDFLRIWLWW